MDVGPSNLKKRNLGAYAYGAWTCSNPDNSRDKKCSLNLFQVNSLCGTAVSPVQDDDECEAHAAFLVESEGFGVLDCGATTSFGSVEGAEALFSKSHEHDTRFPEVDPLGGRSLNFGSGASSKATSLSRLPVRNDALGDFWIPVHLFVDQPKPTPLMAKTLFNSQCSLNVDGLCLCRVVACTPCHCAVSIGSLHHETNDKLHPQGTIVWRFLMSTCIYHTMST